MKIRHLDISYLRGSWNSQWRNSSDRTKQNYESLIAFMVPIQCSSYYQVQALFNVCECVLKCHIIIACVFLTHTFLEGPSIKFQVEVHVTWTASCHGHFIFATLYLWKCIRQ